MGTVFAVLKRDIRRLLKAPSALAIAIALMVFPSLYTWYNVVGFWDPYGSTAGMRVAVVNLDQGGSSEMTGSMNLGDMIVDALQDEPRLNWSFDDYDTAMADLSSGKDYAVFVVPEDFTKRLLALTEGRLEEPKIEYYVNEKVGPVAPKITDAGSTMLEEGISSAFVTAVGEAAFQSVESAFEDIETSFDADSLLAVQELDRAAAAIEDVRSGLAQSQDDLSGIQQKCTTARSSLDSAQASLESANTGLKQVTQDVVDAQALLQDSALQASEAVDEAYYALSGLASIAEAIGYGSEVKAAADLLKSTSDVLYASALPAESGGLAGLSGMSGKLDSSLANQKLLISQTKEIVDQLSSTVETAKTAVDTTDELLAGAQADLESARVDFSSLSNATSLSPLLSDGKMDARSFGGFLGEPTAIETEKLYEVDTFGAAMAPLFMSLTFWIGTIMILVVMKEEVDEEEVGRLRPWQRYLARLLLFLIIAVMQGLVCCAVVPLLGVEVLSMPALFCAAVVASASYLCVTYALCIMFRHVGIGLCIILVFLQIPAATGLYPVEMTAGYYLALSPFFPLTYGIDALREAMCGFYGLHYLKDILMLLLIMFSSLAMGLLCSPLLSNVNRTFAQQIGESGLFNGEAVEVPERKFRIAQITSMLIDREDFRGQLIRRYSRFSAVYSYLAPALIVSCLLVPVLLAIVITLFSGAKALILGLWLAFVILMFVALTVAETLRASLERQLELSSMSEDEAKVLLAERKRSRFSWGLRKRGDSPAEDAAQENGLPAGGLIEDDSPAEDAAQEGVFESNSAVFFPLFDDDSGNEESSCADEHCEEEGFAEEAPEGASLADGSAADDYHESSTCADPAAEEGANNA